MRIAKLLGKLKIWQQRLASYVGIVNFVMIFYLYIIEAPMGLLWYHWAVIIFVGASSLMFIDVKFIMPNSLVYSFQKNAEFQEIKRDIKEIKKILKE